VIIGFLQRGRDVIPEGGRHLGAAATTRLSPVTGAIASSMSAISSSLAPAASARPALHTRQTAGDPGPPTPLPEAMPRS
jgi:hypothetical protein